MVWSGACPIAKFIITRYEVIDVRYTDLNMTIYKIFFSMYRMKGILEFLKKYLVFFN